jgi:hypothetical protein
MRGCPGDAYPPPAAGRDSARWLPTWLPAGTCPAAILDRHRNNTLTCENTKSC